MQFKRVAGGAALLALALVLMVPCFAAVTGGSGGGAISADTCRRVSPDSPVSDPLGKKGGGRLALWLSGGFLAFGLTITTLRAANQPLPVNSYTAKVAILDGDSSPSLVPHGLPFTPTVLMLTPSILGAATAGLAITADGTNLIIAHATGSTTGCTVIVSGSRPTTNNAP